MNNFMGEIQIFGFNYAPYQWAFCDGTIMSVSQNSALFALLGVTYGGNGTSNFALPNLQGQAACATGLGVGLSNYEMGETFGSESVTLLQPELPGHTHTESIFLQNDTAQRFASPVAGCSPVAPMNSTPFTKSTAANGSFAPTSIGPNNGGLPHANQQPYLALNFCIALQGAFPQRP
jgi:microcystin-dependent protein